jgi:hypothetical protein
MTKTNLTSVDTTTLYLGGVEVTATASELNKTADQEYQLLVGNGAMTVKNGICHIAKTVPGAVAATLANPVDVTDDYKRLTIINFQAQVNTVTLTGGFGNGGTGEDVATFTNTIGNTLSLMAYNAKWYIIGKTGVAIA